MKKTRKTEEVNEEEIVKENIQKRFKTMFSGKGEPLSNMSIQQVEALKARIEQLEDELAQDSETRQTRVLHKSAPRSLSSPALLQPPIIKTEGNYRLRLADALSNISMRWKMGLMVFILLLAMAGVTTSAYLGLQSLRYHLSNIYDFMLIPIVAINNADTALADAQYHIQVLYAQKITATELSQSLSDVETDNSLAEQVISRYNNEWITTSSPEFTQQLSDAGKLGLQHQEVATLESFHVSFTGYEAKLEEYLRSVRAGQADPKLAHNAIEQLQKARDNLQVLIEINNQFANISNVQAQAAYRQAFSASLLVFTISILLGSFISYMIVISITSRLGILTRSAAAMQEGNLDQVVSIPGRDEVSLLGSTFNTMAVQLKNLFNTLEQRVLDRTHDLELASEVGRTVAEKVTHLSEMLSEAVEMIRARFDLYYTQIYLVDPSGKTITLRAGTGEPGKELLQKGHHLPIDPGSLNGRAASEKRSVIVNDTKDNPNFLPNPLLPKTRSEMVVPLIVSGKLVGVLDMQGAEPGALNEINLTAFEALAGQLAIAIQNAALLTEASEARAEVEAQIRRLTEEGWQDFLNAIDRGQIIGYAFEQSTIIPLQADTLSMKSEDRDFSIPITITGTKIGEIQLPMEQDRAWTANELELIKATGAQLAQHIENLRLLAQAEKYRSEAVQAIRRLTHESWDTYLQTHAEIEPGYMFDLTEVRPLPEKNNGASHHSIKHPMTIRDEFIGELTVDAPDDSEEAAEIMAAVAEQLSGHIENLRLSELNERNAQREQALRQITIALRSSTNPATILRTAVHELGSILGRRTVVQLADPGRANPSESAVSNKTGSDSPANQS